MAGDGPAQNNLGVLYREGHGVRHDLCQAVYWFAQSAASGYKEGMKNYALALEKGEGVERDTVEAAYWRQKGQELE